MDEEIEQNNENKELVQVIGNHIYFYTDVNKESSLQAVKAIKKLNNEIKISKFLTQNEEEYEDDEDCDTKINVYSPIYFHINSNGGDFFSGMAIVDAIKKSKVPVYTIGEGGIASMASMIFLAGYKKFINENAYILIHELRTFACGTFSNIVDNYENTKMFMEHIKKFYKENSKINKKNLENILKKDIWFNSSTSIKYGFADKII